MTVDAVRRTGRPDQQASEELVRHIVRTAARLFIDQGYAATSIEQIAAAAGSGKQTIYRHFLSKEALFLEVIQRQAQYLLELAKAAGAASPDPIEALKESCRRLFDFGQAPGVVRLHRILIAESERFPELGRRVLEISMEPFRVLFTRLLTEAMDAGRLRRMNPELAQDLLGSLCVAWPMRQVLLGGEAFSTSEQRERYFDEAWALFLRGMQ